MYTSQEAAYALLGTAKPSHQTVLSGTLAHIIGPGLSMELLGHSSACNRARELCAAAWPFIAQYSRRICRLKLLLVILLLPA